MSSEQFEHALAATNMLPGPASTQLAIYCAWRLRGTRGALLGGLCFICPGLAMIIALSALFLSGSPPDWLRGGRHGRGRGGRRRRGPRGFRPGAPIWHAAAGSRRAAVAVVCARIGGRGRRDARAWLVLVLLGARRGRARGRARARPGLARWRPRRLAAPPHSRAAGGPLPALAATLADPGGTGALAWTALKVGALAFGGGFVIVPLMQADAVSTYHWMTHAQFLNAVALGQITPGPVTQTVAAVGYAAGGLPDALLAAAVAFAPSFSFILLGGERFERLLANSASAPSSPARPRRPRGRSSARRYRWPRRSPRAGSTCCWRRPRCRCSSLRRGVLITLLTAGCAGAVAGALGAPIVH